MGNELNAQNVKSNLSSYKPDFSSYQPILSTQYRTKNQDHSVFVWQHRQTLMRLIEKKYFVRTWLQFHELLDIFALRYNDPLIVSAKYLKVELQAIENLDTSGPFPETWASIYYEETLTNLSYFDEIPQQDGAYFLLQALKGFQKLSQKTNFFFEVKQEMFHITQSRQVKIWLCENIWQSRAIDSVRPLSNEYQMICQILSILQKSISFTTESQKNLAQKDKIHIQPIIIDQLLRIAPQTFKEAIELTWRHFESDKVEVGKQMGCLKNLSQDEINKIFQTTKNKHKASHLETPITPLKYLSSVPHPAPYNQFQSQLDPIHRDNSQNISKLHSTSLNTVQRLQKGQNSHSVRGSRQKSNKKSGISLVKNRKHESIDKKNHHSMLVIKPRPQSSHNQQSIITFIKPSLPLTPKVTFNLQTIEYNQSSHVNQFAANKPSKTTLVKRGNSLLNSHQSKGITVTNKVDFGKKSANLVIGRKFDRSQGKPDGKYVSNDGIIGLRNEKRKEANDKQQKIMMGTFPDPLYGNNSSAMPKNCHMVMQSQTFSSNMSFDPVIPNQSLTRFQKEFIGNSSPNCSSQEFYQIPKIYVHSPPKNQNKIFKLDCVRNQSISFKTHSLKGRQENIHQERYQRKMNLESGSDSVQQSSQTAQNRENRLDEYQSYIHQNQSVFTHPVLYDYITNKPKNHFVEKQKAKPRQYIDYLNNVQISESLDINTAQKLFEANYQRAEHQKLQQKRDYSPPQYSINDFPTIEEIEENPHDQQSDKENASFLPIHINLAPQSNPQHHLPSVRRGYEQSFVVEYKKFYDDTNRSNNSPNKHFFSPLKKNHFVINQAEIIPFIHENKKYETAKNWQTSPSKPMLQRPSSVYPMVYQNNQMVQIHQKRNYSPSPVSKLIYKGQKPSINPLLMQDLQKIRQTRMY